MDPLSKIELRATKATRHDFPSITRHPIYLVLDNLKAAHNIGTLLRLSDALLVERVFICGGQTIVPPNRKIRDGSRGAERWVPWEYRESAAEVLRELKKNGVQIVSIELCERSIPYTDLHCAFPVCIVAGREYDGVSPEVLALSDDIVSLPMFGMANSLNVATAISVVLYESHRQLQLSE